MKATSCKKTNKKIKRGKKWYEGRSSLRPNFRFVGISSAYLGISNCYRLILRVGRSNFPQSSDAQDG